MKALFHFTSIVALAALLSGTARAEEEDDEKDEMTQDRVTGGALPPLRGDVTVRADGLVLPTAEPMMGEYPARIVKGAEILKMDTEFVNECWVAMEGLYKRDYKTSKTKFEAIETRWPGSAIGPVGQALVWQALMLENFDFKYDSQYTNTFNRSRQALTVGLQTPGNDIWETFLMGAMMGVDAIHAMRKLEFTTAISRGLDAMKYVSRASEMAPEFVDAQLGDGLWLYWRSVIAMSTKGVPSFVDEREKGIQLMTNAQERSVFLRPAAGHALTYTWIEEGYTTRALRTALGLQRQYPNNIINLLVLGRVQMYKKLYAESEATYKNVLRIDAKNQRVHYYLERLYLRWNKYDEALKHADLYLAFTDLSKDHRASALYYKGSVYMRMKDYTKAEAAYKEAWDVGKLKRAKSRLDLIQKRRAEGTL